MTPCVAAISVRQRLSNFFYLASKFFDAARPGEAFPASVAPSAVRILSLAREMPQSKGPQSSVQNPGRGTLHEKT
jgi:hypothetical protein